VVVAFTQGIAPVPVLGADGRAHGIGLGLADQPYAVGLDEVLQHAGAGVVTGDKEHLEGRHLGLRRIGFFLAQRVPTAFLLPVSFMPLPVVRHHRLVYRLSKPACPSEGSLSRGGRGDDERLQARVVEFSPVRYPDRFVECRSQHGDSAQQEDIPLGGGIAPADHPLEESGPRILRKGGRDIFHGLFLVRTRVRV